MNSKLCAFTVSKILIFILRDTLSCRKYLLITKYSYLNKVAIIYVQYLGRMG